MFQPPNLQNLAWAVTTLLKAVLLYYLLQRRLYRSHPVFFVYALATLLQTLLLAFAYRHWGFHSIESWDIYWGSQACVVAARWFAIVEIARKILANYYGIWTLARRILFAIGISALLYSVLSSWNNLTTLVLDTDRGVELAIAAFLVSLFLFARYYRLPVGPLERYLATGFCLFSCSSVVNAYVYVRSTPSSNELWSYLDVLAFFATLLLWISAARKYSHAPVASVTESISPEMYVKLSLEMNARLYLLNKRLTHLLRTEDSRL